MQKSALGETATEPFNKNTGQAKLVRTERGRVPLVSVHVIDRNERGFASHREPDVTSLEFCIDRLAQVAQMLPLLFRVRFRDSRIFMYALHVHFMNKLYLTFTHHSRNRSGRSRLGARGEGYMSLSRE